MAVQSASDYEFSSTDTCDVMISASEKSHSTFTTEGFDVTVYRDFDVAAPEWQAFEKQADGLPYQRFGWVRAWQEAVGEDGAIEPVLVIARRNGAIAFALPLGLERRRGCTVLTFLGQENTNQNTGLWAPGCNADISADAMGRILGDICRHAGADLLHLANIPLTWENRPSPLLMRERTDSPSPFFAGKIGNDFDGLFRESFSKKSAKNLIRKQRRLEAAGNFRIFEAETAEDIRRALAVFFEQRTRREADAGIPSGFSSPGRRLFLEKLAALHSGDVDPSPDTRLGIWVLEAGGAVRATYLTFRQGDRLIGYSTSISHDELVACSPGVVLLKNIIEAACADPEIQILDLGLGDERYKHPWTEPMPLCDSFLAVTAWGWMNLQAIKARQFAKAKVRNSHTLWQLVRKLRQVACKLGG